MFFDNAQLRWHEGQPFNDLFTKRSHIASAAAGRACFWLNKTNIARHVVGDRDFLATSHAARLCCSRFWVVRYRGVCLIFSIKLINRFNWLRCPACLFTLLTELHILQFAEPRSEQTVVGLYDFQFGRLR